MAWLITMELLLQHPGQSIRIASDAGVGLMCVLGIVAGTQSSPAGWHRWLALPGAALSAYGVICYRGASHAAHFEGFAIVLSVLVILEGVLMLAEARQTAWLLKNPPSPER